MANVNIKVGYTIDKTGLNEIKRQLTDIKTQAAQAKLSGNLTDGLKEASKAASQLENILNSAWNSKIGQLDLSKVNTSIKNTYGSAQELQQALIKGGSSGATAYNSFATQVLNTNLQLKQTNKTLDNMAITLKNTIRYGISSSIFNNFTNSIQKAYDYTVRLDTSLNDIRIVTSKSADEMDKFAIKANQVAKDLGRSTKDFTEASLIYYQQGLGNEEAQARAEVTMKAANVTGQTGREVSEQLTAVWNGYKVTAEEAELYVDKLAAVAAGTASDLEELSSGMSKVASAANLMGVDIDQLNAQLATVVSVTRQAPESVGTAFKTIYARMGDIEAGLDDEVTLGKYTSAMAEMGINVLDANNQLRDMGEVIEEIGNKWTTMSREQQIALSQTMAGTRQYNNLLSLFDNWDMYQDALKMSAESAGTLQKQQDIYMESTKAHLQQLSTEAERTYDILFNQDTVNGFADALTGVLSIFNDLLAGLGGGMHDFAFFGSTIANIFNKQIGASIEKQIENIEAIRANAQALNLKGDIADSILNQQIIGQHAAQGQDIGSAGLEKEAQIAKQLLEVRQGLSSEQYNELTNLQAQVGLEEDRIQYLSEYKNIAVEILDYEYATTRDFQERLNIEKENLQIRQDELKELNSQLNFYKNSDLGSLTDDDTNWLFQRVDSLKSIASSQKEFNTLEEASVKISQKRALDENEIKTVLETENYLVQQQQVLTDKVKQGAEGRIAAENNVIQQLKNEQAERERIIQQTIEQAERQNTIAELVKGITALFSLLTAVSGIIETINDDTLSAEEKTKRIFTVALANLPILLMNLEALSKLLPSLISGTNILAMTMGAEGVTAASGFGASLLGIIGVAGPYVLAIGAIIAVIYALVKAYNADADAARDAAKAAEDLKKNYESLSQAATELTDNIADYTKAKKGLEELDKNTEEYAQTLEETNDKAKELIETLKLYDKYTIKDGLIEINEDALKEVQNEAKNRERSAEQAMYASQVYSNRMNYRSNLTDLVRAVGYNTNARGERVAATNAQIESVIDKLKSLSDVEYNRIMNSEEAFNEWIDTTFKGDYQMMLLSENIAKQSKAFDNLIKKTDEAAQANEYYAKQIMSSVIEEKYSNQAESLATRQKLSGEEYVDENRANQIRTILETYSQSNTKELQERLDNIEARNNLWNRDLRNYEYQGQKLSAANDEELARTFARIVLGRTDTDDLVYKGGIGKGTLRTASGESVVEGMSDKQMRQQIVLTLETENITEEIEESLDKDNILNGIQSIISSATDFGKEYGTDFSDALVAALSSEDNKIDLTETFTRLDPDEVAEMQGLTGDQLRERLGLTDEVVSAIGAETTEKLLNSFSESLAEYDWNIDSAIETSMEKIGSELAEAEEGLSKKKMAEYSDEVRVYAKNLMELADVSSEVSEDMKYDSDTAVEFALSIVRMNKAIETLAKNFDDWKDIIENSSEVSQEYAEAMYGIEEALSEIFGIETDYISQDFVKEHLDEISEAAEGSETAIEELRKQLGDELIVQIAIDNNIANTDNILNQFQSLRNQVESITSGMQVGTNIDDSSLVAALNKIVSDAGMTVDQANQMFAALRLEPTYATETVMQKQKIARTETTHRVIASGTTQVGDNEVPYWTTVDEVKELPPIESEMEVPITAIRGDGQQPTISGVKLAPSSSFSNYSSGNKGGGSPSGKSGKSGGGGGGSKAKEPDKMDPVEQEIDRYHDVDVQLELISKDLDKLDKQRKKLFGKDLIANLNKRLDLLNKQIGTTTSKIEIARGEAVELQGTLSGKGVTFNPDGTIANYAAAYTSQLNYVNSLIAQYNGMSAEAQEGFKDTVEQAKKDFDDFVKDIDRYDEIITDTIPNLEADIQDAIDEKIDLQIEKFDMEIEIRLDLAEAERDWNDFKKKIIDGIEDDDILGNAMAKLVDFSSYYKEDNTGIVQALRKQVDNTLAQLNQMDKRGWSDVYGDNRTAALDDLKKYYEELMTNLEDVLKLQEEIHESYMDMMDEAQEKFDEQIDAYEMISDLIEHDMEVISLVYGDEAYNQLAKYYDKQQQNYNNQLDFQRQQVDFWRAQLDALEEGSDAWENAKEKWSDAVEDLNELIEESIENLQDRYLNAINLIFQNLNNKVTDNLGLDYIEEEWKLINDNADQYLDTINSLYEVQKLENKYLDALDQTDSISAQRQLKKIMDEELADLRERDKLTEYDIERANKKYEIALKQIALQEAQQNKTKMRLRRDSQGNYRYEYTSDVDQIGQLQDELNDMYNSLYNFDKARYQENLNQMYDVWVEFQEKMAEAAQINDPVARSERELLLQTQYEQLINGITEQNTTIRNNLQESAFGDLANLYDVNVSNFQKMSEEQKNEIMDGLVPYWESGVQHMTDVFAGDEGFLGVCKDAFDQLHEATRDYEDGLDELEVTGRIDFESIGEGIDEDIDRTEQLINDNTELINTYEQELAAIQSVIGELDGLIDKYNAAREAAIAATKAAYDYWSEQQRQAAAAAAANSGAGSGGNPGSAGGSSGGSGSGSGGASTGGADGNLVVGEAVTFNGSYYYDSYGTRPSGSKYSGVANGVIVDMVTGNPYGIHIHSADGRYPDLGWVRRSQLSGYDTGGYTGEWGNDGRLALLHQKELVLNKDDTANMLNAINIMRNITDTLGSSVLNKLAAATAGNFGTNIGSDVLEQNVHIDAQFPNVKDSREIEEALNNLVNMASMRANRK